MNKKQKIIALTLLTWLISANMTVFAAEALPDMSSPFDIPAGAIPSLTPKATNDGAAIPSLTPKATNDGASDAPPSLSIKVDAPKADSGTKDSEVKKDDKVVTGNNNLNDKKPDNKVVSASKSDTVDGQYSDMMGKGDDITVAGAQVIAPKPKKITKSGPEVAFLILPSLVLGYVCSRKRK